MGILMGVPSFSLFCCRKVRMLAWVNLILMLIAGFYPPNGSTTAFSLSRGHTVLVIGHGLTRHSHHLDWLSHVVMYSLACR